MFGKGKQQQSVSFDTSRYEQEIETLKSRLAAAEAELEAVNTSTHLGIWKCFYDEAGNQTGVVFTDEFRKMLG